MCLNSKIVFESKPTPPAPKETTSPPSTISKTPDDFVSLTERLIHESINTQRASYGLPELELNSQLSTAARLHSQDMAKYNYFSHTSRDGRNFSTRISEQGLSCSASAENIAMNSGFDEYSTAQSAVEGWMNSKDHRENILKGYSVEGIGVAVAKDGSVYVTEDFC
jgi:uncharacterized protein YkwD